MQGEREVIDFDERVAGDLSALDAVTRELGNLDVFGGKGPAHIAVDPERVEQGLAKLVLTLIELIRRLMERQAIRRMEAGSLSDDEIERLGVTFIRLDQKMQEMKAIFGLEDEDLNINLGPLGDLM